MTTFERYKHRIDTDITDSPVMFKIEINLPGHAAEPANDNDDCQDEPALSDEEVLADAHRDCLWAVAQLATLCSDYHEHMGSPSIPAVAKRLGIRPDTFAMLVEIGSNGDRLMKAHTCLPFDMKVLRAVSELSEDQFHAACEQGVIHRNMYAADVTYFSTGKWK